MKISFIVIFNWSKR